MMHGRCVFRSAAFAVPFLVISASAWGDILPVDVSGTVWRVAGNYLTVGTSPPAGTVEGTFTAAEINFSVLEAQGTPNPLKEFLNSGGATYGAMGGMDDVMANCTAPGLIKDSTGQDCYSTVIEVTGSANFLAGATYSLSHDDGAVLIVNGLNQINSPAPTSIATHTWTPSADTGYVPFEIWYMATNGNPEQLKLETSQVPEPGVISMLVTMLTGLAGVLLVLKRRLT